MGRSTVNDANVAMWNDSNGELLGRIGSLDPFMCVIRVGARTTLVEYGNAMVTPMDSPAHVFTAPPHERTNAFSPDG